jgi:hypothetical protein
MMACRETLDLNVKPVTLSVSDSNNHSADSETEFARIPRVLPVRKGLPGRPGILCLVITSHQLENKPVPVLYTASFDSPLLTKKLRSGALPSIQLKGMGPAAAATAAACKLHV